MRLSITFDITYLAVQCLHFYIIERFMTFIVKDITSEPKRLDFGFPQGSALGPLLFVLHTHPLSQIVLDSQFVLHKFSDDTNLLNSASSADFNLLFFSKQTER